MGSGSTVLTIVYRVEQNKEDKVVGEGRSIKLRLGSTEGKVDIYRVTHRDFLVNF